MCGLEAVKTIIIRVFTQSLQLLASQISTVDLSQLDQTALKSIRLLQVRGADVKLLHCLHINIYLVGLNSIFFLIFLTESLLDPVCTVGVIQPSAVDLYIFRNVCPYFLRFHHDFIQYCFTGGCFPEAPQLMRADNCINIEAFITLLV